MNLKDQFRDYDALRAEHDAQIVQIAMEAGLRISPDQWSSLLYGYILIKLFFFKIFFYLGDSRHRAHMRMFLKLFFVSK